MTEKILVVDDDPLMLQSLQLRLGDEGYRVQTASDGYAALECCDHTDFDLIICDVKMPGIDGLETLRRIRRNHPDIRSILITGFAGSEAPIQAIRLGVSDYLYKPFEDEQFIHCVHQVLKELQLERENRRLLAELQSQNQKLNLQVKVFRDREKRYFDFANMIGSSPVMTDLFQKVRQLAQTRSTVLLLGESGTGKELVARAIHNSGPRSKECFVAINCSAISRDLLESELFGHRKGAFTGADSEHRGLLEVASGGTVLLDEIGDMPMELQAKLLRVLEQGTLRRVGESAERRIDARIISATNVDLTRRIAEGAFRQDLFYRLNTITLRIPTLRERPEDIPRIAEHFLKTYAAEQGKHLLGFCPATQRWMQQHSWKGNVRELRNAVERAVIFAEEGTTIGWELLPGEEFSPQKMPDTAREECQEGNWNQRLCRFERQLLLEALQKAQGNVTQAARILGISRTNLHNKLTKHRLTPSPDSV